MYKRKLNVKRQIFYESILLIAASFLLGFAYTYITKQGFFYERKPSPALEIISLAKATELFESKSALFIDSRHEFEYVMGHIRGAINVSLNEFDTHRTRLANIPKDKLLIVYCDGVDCNSSVELTLKLMELEFVNVKIFFGGWQEWKNGNLPIDK
jgi:rhodanese-related sulfurtransferase